MPRRWIGLLFASASNCAKCNIVRTDNYPRLCLCLRRRRRLCLSVCLSAKIQGCSLSRTLPRSKRFKVLHTPQKHPGLSCQVVRTAYGRADRSHELAKQTGRGHSVVHNSEAPADHTCPRWASASPAERPAPCHTYALFVRGICI